MNRRSFLVVASLAGAALAGVGRSVVFARPEAARLRVVRADRQWMRSGGTGCAGTGRRSVFAGTDRVAISRLIPAPRA